MYVKQMDKYYDWSMIQHITCTCMLAIGELFYTDCFVYYMPMLNGICDKLYVCHDEEPSTVCMKPQQLMICLYIM